VFLHHPQGAYRLSAKVMNYRNNKIQYIHNLPTIRFYHNDILMYCILLFQQFITLADKTCKLREDGVRTPKHVGIILILILYYFYVHLLVY